MTPEEKAALHASLATAAARGDPLTAIYARLFAKLPETEALFVLDTGGRKRGEMLAQAFELIDDHLGEQRFAASHLANQLYLHNEIGLDPALFPAFFIAIAEGLADTAGLAWTPAMSQAWVSLTHELAEISNLPR